MAPFEPTLTSLPCIDHLSYRFWDAGNNAEIKKIELSAPVNDVELSRDGTTLIVSYGNHVAFYDANSLVLY